MMYYCLSCSNLLTKNLKQRISQGLFRPGKGHYHVGALLFNLFLFVGFLTTVFYQGTIKIMLIFKINGGVFFHINTLF